MAESFSFLFPAYTLIYSRSKTAYVLKAEDRLAIPIFSDLDNAESFVRKSDIKDCDIVEFMGPENLIHFIENMPLIPGRAKPDSVVVDPLDMVSRLHLNAFTCDQVITAILRD